MVLLRGTFKHKLMSVPLPGDLEADAYVAPTSSELKLALALLRREKCSFLRQNLTVFVYLPAYF